MPFSPRPDGSTAPMPGTSSSRSSPQRRLPPLKQQLLQQSNHFYYSPQQNASSGTYNSNASTSPNHITQHPSDDNNNKNGRSGHQYSKSFRFSNASPYHFSNSIAYLGVTPSTKTTPSLSTTGPARTPPSEVIRKRAPKARQQQLRVPMMRSMSQHGGTQLKVTGHNSHQEPHVEITTDNNVAQGDCLDLKGSTNERPGKEAHELICGVGNRQIRKSYTSKPVDLNPDVVSQYLRQNPEVLDHHVSAHVNTDRLKKWLQLKSGTSRSASSRLQLVKTNGEVNSDKNLTLTRWKNKMQASKGKLLQDLSRDFHHTNSKVSVLLELAECVCAALSADAYTLYSCDSEKQELTHISKGEHGDVIYGAKERVGLGTSVSASVAFSKEPMRLQDLLEGKKHPDRLTVSDSKAHCILALPIIDDGDTCFGVVEFYRHSKNSKFTEEEEEVTIHMLQWYDLLVDYVEISSLLLAMGTTALVKSETHSTMIRQRTLSDFLLEVTKSIFQDIVSMDIVIIKIMNFAQRLVHADRASLFLVDNCKRELYARIFDIGVASKAFLDKCSFQSKENFAKALVHADRASLFLLDTRSNELYARIFDDGYSLDEFASASESKMKQTSEKGSHAEKSQAEQKSGGSVDDKELEKEKEKKKKPEWHNQDIRFSMDKGVAGYVASTGKILNIKDAYKDKRFNPEVDIRTGYTTKTILCMPIFIRGSVIGVVQMVNKINGTFTKSDEEAFETFAIYCGLALHHAKLYEKIRRSEQKYKVALDVLSYHSQASVEEVNDLKRRPVPDEIPNITRYDFSPWAVMDDEKPLYCLYMFKKLFSNLKYELEDLMRFTLTVKRNYRNVPYHNWTHAFSVAHSMFTVIETAKHNLTPVESIALFVSCLCHDLDHRGKTNQFMVQSASPLAAIYSTSTMEHHHFNQTVTILQNEGHNIFKYLTSDEYKMVLSDIKQSILATDLAVFFKNKVTMQNILSSGTFNWDTIHHRNTLLAVSMTACDLCAMYKPWDVQQTLVYIIMEEFWEQGDEEKKRGLTPIQMMDRDRKDDLPNLEVGFIQSICVPCYELMSTVIPDTKPMLDGALANLHRWKEMADEMSKDKNAQV